MTDSIPKALRWHEGMLLAPQHFQQQSARLEAALHFYAGRAAPYFYGVCEISVDAAMLNSKRFRIESIDAIMPDGLYISKPPPLLDLAPFKAEAEKAPLRIYLCVPKADTATKVGAMARFTVGKAEETDDTDPNADEGQHAVTIERLEPNATLVALESSTGGYTRMPVAEVEYTDSAFRLTNYVPPMLKVADKPWCAWLTDRCREIARQVRGKADYLLQMIRSPVGSANRPNFERQLNSLMAALPEYEVHLESGEVHPYNLYISLCTLAAHVATVGMVTEVPQYPRYDHENITEIFESVGGSLNTAIELGVQESFTEYRFDGEGHQFTLPFREEWVGRKIVLGFMGTPPPEIVAWAESSYIGTDRHIQSMTRNRDIGCGRERDDAHEGLRRRPGTILFTLAEDLRRIEPGETIHVYNPVKSPSDPAPQAVLLYIKHEQEE